MRLNFQKTVNFSVVLTTTLLLLTSASSAFGNSRAASIESLIGYVTATNSNGEVKRLTDSDTLNEGDVLNTGSASSISITLANGDLIQLGELDTYTVGAADDTKNKGGSFAQRSLNKKSPTLSTAISAGGGVAVPTTPAPGGSPSN
ncbi:hypothetical protein [Arenicella xantha]|uniref:DUF5666 domain-containing protein n=1 Tax=Arenicella xantha TaxID=644221 RepID=A0A395JN94_9GAMM|nr:hypothetical protein [Arenicella xantha]RBP52947.1 hypothetical protein DFR28_101331 [Arenicella xantha]